MPTTDPLSIAAVDVIADPYRVDYFGGSLSVQVDYRDFNGETHALCISAHAIRDLGDKLHEAQMAMLERSVNPSHGLAFDLITGPTRGETYLPSSGDGL